ncbi:unnamed protein product [Trichobilharzia szidati]|nr:unnamed protein product [Trichobilharzia szidati]
MPEEDKTAGSAEKAENIKPGETTETKVTASNTTSGTAAPAAAAEQEAEEVKTYKCVNLTAFGGSKHVRIDTNEVKPVGKNEVAIEVQAW